MKKQMNIEQKVKALKAEDQKLEQDTNVIQYLGKNLAEDLFIAWDEMPEYDKFKINITIKPIK